MDRDVSVCDGGNAMTDATLFPSVVTDVRARGDVLGPAAEQQPLAGPHRTEVGPCEAPGGHT